MDEKAWLSHSSSFFSYLFILRESSSGICMLLFLLLLLHNCIISLFNLSRLDGLKCLLFVIRLGICRLWRKEICLYSMVTFLIVIYFVSNISAFENSSHL